MEIAVGIGKILVFQESDVFGLLRGDFGQFPRDFIEFVGKTGPDSEKKCCHGPN